MEFLFFKWYKRVPLGNDMSEYWYNEIYKELVIVSQTVTFEIQTYINTDAGTRPPPSTTLNVPTTTTTTTTTTQPTTTTTLPTSKKTSSKQQSIPNNN